ncbi:MbtH family protein [Streptomyces sp. NPDC087440]|uniref:MbtH family protein n=1 Tax=Streptomyces sp. NPDC087440 TaxID=3365790 RepID=UPI0038066D1B
MTHPFDDPDSDYQILVNSREQHSMWPSGIRVPHGWSPVFGPDSRQACRDYVEARWTDIRPVPLRTAP